MSRGRKPLMAMREAVLIAKKRGETRQFMHEPGTICNFVIFCPGFTAFVRIKRVTRVHCSHARIESEAADALATLRAIAHGTGISRELWVFLPRGAFRFFRVDENGLIELNRDGTVMPAKARAGVPAPQGGAARPIAGAGTAPAPVTQPVVPLLPARPEPVARPTTPTEIHPGEPENLFFPGPGGNSCGRAGRSSPAIPPRSPGSASGGRSTRWHKRSCGSRGRDGGSP